MRTQTISNELAELFNSSGANIPEYVLKKKICDSKFKTFLAQTTSDDKLYVAKVFPAKDKAISQSFLNELLFAKLDHPHIAQPCFWEV
mmetsp:Transcript_25917/g.22854  ORF Transcript_25917/g.22854 Transcript_25917/m.22854 type:complete len:88 (-) Transcript_25917:824-1087(-)